MGIGINLHAIVREAITFVNPDEEVILYQSLGQKNIKSKVTPIYAEGKSVKAQFQPLSEDRLNHLESISVATPSAQVFLYSDETLPVAGITRSPFARTGDFILKNGVYYLVTSVIEDWSRNGWINVEVTKQITPPDFSKSDWYVEEGNG